MGERYSGQDAAEHLRRLYCGHGDELDAMAAEVERLRALVGDENQPGWDGCSRAEAIRQANEFHANQMKWMNDFYRLRDDLHARVAELVRQRDAVLAIVDRQPIDARRAYADIRAVYGVRQ